MEAYYKRYRKALRGEEKVRKRLALIKNELVGIEGKILIVDEAAAIDDIVDMSPTSRQERVKQAATVVGRRYLSSDGFEIVVGRGAKENDAVTFGVGRPGDLWLHAREARGSHVIVRRKEKGKPFPKRTIEEAAALASYFSKSRNAEIVPVIVTERRYVAKIKGSPGLVRVMQEEVIFAEPREVLKVKTTV
jgi:predicted ribosome quality control (RQC) complex YloA/Tae2 family protein